MEQEYTVMVVDDSAFAQKVIRSYLTDTEFKVIAVASSGEEAIAKFKERDPELLLLDVILPDLRGPDILKSIIELKPEARVLMVSSLGTEDTVTECLANGARNFVQKPVDRETLLAQLRNLVAE